MDYQFTNDLLLGLAPPPKPSKQSLEVRGVRPDILERNIAAMIFSTMDVGNIIAVLSGKKRAVRGITIYSDCSRYKEVAVAWIRTAVFGVSACF